MVAAGGEVWMLDRSWGALLVVECLKPAFFGASVSILVSLMSFLIIDKNIPIVEWPQQGGSSLKFEKIHGLRAPHPLSIHFWEK